MGDVDSSQVTSSQVRGTFQVIDTLIQSIAGESPGLASGVVGRWWDSSAASSSGNLEGTAVGGGAHDPLPTLYLDRREYESLRSLPGEVLIGLGDRAVLPSDSSLPRLAVVTDDERRSPGAPRAAPARTARARPGPTRRPG